MTARQSIFMVIMAALALGLAGTAWAAPGGLPACQAALKTCNASLTSSQASLATCNASLTSTQASLATCNTALAACQANAASAFPATGQTTCYNSVGTIIACAGTGQDGEIQAGATLSYTDTGVGTIIDNNTGLEWEKKSDEEAVDDGDNTDFPHDKDNLYSWGNAFLVHVAGLNTANFAGFNDWRLPNVKELQSIQNLEVVGLAVSAVFLTNCMPGATVLTGSCTDSFGYWSSTTVANIPSFAWVVGFGNGGVIEGNKGGGQLVRAVRGGL